jgi:cytochrome oxidase Cu insertion factor (SCO1/SenC/PrrC family)
MSVRVSLALAIIALPVFAAGVWMVVGGLQESRELGPVDGHDLPPTDLERVATDDVAPDFSLRALSGEIVTLSDLRGRRNVVLVFYRGHW